VTVRGFAPIADRNARLLILGSMPGIASLEAHQYYAHPRNAFWPIVEALWKVPRDLDYGDRAAALRAAGVAVWDVLAQCRRRSSLDSDIDAASIVVNDFRGFFDRHPGIRLIGFNGGAAGLLYRRHVLPGLTEKLRGIATLQLPSTSPAHAGRSLQQKLSLWRQLALTPEPTESAAGRHS
jgi:double-stranded uracil-DNA glycosylase